MELQEIVLQDLQLINIFKISRTSNISKYDQIHVTKYETFLLWSLNDVVYVTDSLAVDALLQLAPDCIVHRVEIRAVWRPVQSDVMTMSGPGTVNSRY